MANQAAYDRLARMRSSGLISEHTWQILAPTLEQYSRVLAQAAKEVLASNPQLEAEEMENARRELLQAQRSTLGSLVRDGVITEEIYSQLVAEVDSALTSDVTSWPELVHSQRPPEISMDRLIAAAIQEQDLENAASGLTKLGFSITHLPSTGGFLRRGNITLLIGLPSGHEAEAVEALNRSCKQRVEYLSTPPEVGVPFPLPSPMPVTIGGATIFVFEVERLESF